MVKCIAVNSGNKKQCSNDAKHKGYCHVHSSIYLIKELEDQIALLDAKVIARQSDLSGINEKIRISESKLAEKNKQLANLGDKYRELEFETDDKIKRAIQKSDDMEHSATEQTLELNKVKREIVTLRSTNESLQAELSQNQVSSKIILERFNKLQHDFDDMKLELELEKEKKADVQVICKPAEEKVDFSEEIIEIREINRELRKEMEKQELEHKKTQNSLKSCIEDFKLLESEYNYIRAQNLELTKLTYTKEDNFASSETKLSDQVTRLSNQLFTVREAVNDLFNSMRTGDQSRFNAGLEALNMIIN